MKKVQLILALVALMVMSSVGFALNQVPYTNPEDFDGDDFETPGLWTTWGDPYFNGSGQFIEEEMTLTDTPNPWTVDVYQGDGMYRTIGAGSSTMHVSWSTFDLDPTSFTPGGWNAYQVEIADDGIDGEGQARSGDDRFTIVISTWWNTNTEWGELGDRTGVYVDAFNNDKGYEEHYGYELGESITDFDLTLYWNELVGSFTMDWSANGDTVGDRWNTSGMFDASTEDREEYLHADFGAYDEETETYIPGDAAPTFALDSYYLVPEPATIALLGLGGLVLLRRRTR